MLVKSEVAKGLQLYVHHDEDATVWIDGVVATELAGYTSDYEFVGIRQAARRCLSQGLAQGRVTRAGHCRQTQGGQYLDVGIVAVERVER